MSTAIIKEEFEKLVGLNWTEDELVLVHKIKDSIIFCTKLVPSSLKKDVVSAIQLIYRLKSELEEAKKP